MGIVVAKMILKDLTLDFSFDPRLFVDGNEYWCLS